MFQTEIRVLSPFAAKVANAVAPMMQTENPRAVVAAFVDIALGIAVACGRTETQFFDVLRQTIDERQAAGKGFKLKEPN